MAPKCSKDERPKVVEAYIKLLSLPPTFKVSGNALQNICTYNTNAPSNPFTLYTVQSPRQAASYLVELMKFVIGSDYSLFVSDSLSWLWRVVSSSCNESIIYSAYKSISAYPLETIQLKMLPEYARQQVKLPTEYCATPADAAR